MDLTAINKFISDAIDQKQELLESVAKQIYDFAEVRFMEYKSSALLIETLEAEGFTVTRGVGELDTAFIAEFGSGKPVLGFLGEYDALPNLSQKPGLDYQEALVVGGNGHGCGHNLLGTASLAGALALKDAIEKFNLTGTVRYYGCPAEEGGSGKTFMAREGVFDDVDTALCWHPAPDNVVWGVSSLANLQAEYSFKGITAHAGIAPEMGRSALDAVELMNVGANYLREHVSTDVRFHYAMTDSGGTSPGVVQGSAKVMYLIRAPKTQLVNEVYERMNDIARGAALMTGTEVSIRFDKACSNYIPNHVLASTMNTVFEDLGVPQFTAEEDEFAGRIRATIPEAARAKEFVSDMLDAKGRKLEQQAKDKNLSDFLYPYSEGITEKSIGASTDVGDVSWLVPTVQCLVASHVRQTSAHTWQWTTTGRGSIGLKGMAHAGKVMGATALYLLENQELIAQAKTELAEKTAGTPYENPIPAGIQPQK
ncbi:aminobenzoyl-glutamate utilization protein B [Lactococcus hodotermopsidis]|uniref:Aminobenzoyl-glutamate utilization protein B n=1 Tax=Pseudolactococcus hodotermopsidis TaxID=2709157 RepID=A0A6A0BCJ1_9LACT|nr:amidohydrolase [Lactococcus hodotermopsidis]GFH42078.1 aminobenzoyl-glutamate utilization protein B [Lactococcus hodotermopsidis]